MEKMSVPFSRSYCSLDDNLLKKITVSRMRPCRAITLLLPTQTGEEELMRTSRRGL
jgi:hypothetical protein